MNKAALLKLFVIVTFLLSFTCIYAYCAENKEISQYPAVVEVKGSVSVQLSGGTWAPAEIGTYVPEKTLIKTGADSSCDISLDNSLDNIVSVSADTTIEIGALLKKVTITKGRVFTMLNGLPKGSSFEVQTPVAIAGVRGTGWETIVGAKAKFSVNNGTVDVTGVGNGPQNSSTPVPGGKSLTANENGLLGALQDLTDEEKKALQDWADKLALYKKRGICAIMTKCGFMDVLAKMLGIKLPENFDSLSREEQFKVRSNMLSEKGISDFSGGTCSDIVTNGLAAEVLAKVISVPSNIVSTDDKVKYFYNLGFLTDSVAEDVLSTCSAKPIIEAYTPPTPPSLPEQPNYIPEKPASPVQ